jgi:hypothetical protein
MVSLGFSLRGPFIGGGDGSGLGGDDVVVNHGILNRDTPCCHRNGCLRQADGDISGVREDSLCHLRRWCRRMSITVMFSDFSRSLVEVPAVCLMMIMRVTNSCFPCCRYLRRPHDGDVW